MAVSVAHPLVVPMPRLVPPTGGVLRRWVLSQLRASWAGGRLDLELPNGSMFRLGEGAAEAFARIHDDRFFLRMMLRGELGAGESFVAGEWSSDDLVGTLRVFLRGTSARGVESPLTRLAQLPSRLRHRWAANTHAGSERNIHAHYDLGNEFYRLFLDDDTLAYSCAIWPPNTVSGSRQVAEVSRQVAGVSVSGSHQVAEVSLADAQRAKLDRLCELLELSPSDHVLEIGCGWGGFALHAARTRGCKVTAITLSREQHALASARVAEAGLADRVEIQYRDYRALAGTYTKICSIEMLEAVGYEYLPAYFATCARVLASGGRFALQTITMPDTRFDDYRKQVDWMQTYIFPGSLIPSLGAIAKASASAGFRIERSEDIGPDYVPTLRAWRQRFLAHCTSGRVRALGFDEPFVRTWLLYLAFSEAAFGERTLGDHQLLLAR